MITSLPERIGLGGDVLRRIADLYDAGQMLRAFELSRELGPLESWSGPEALVMAGRLANNLGAPRLGSRLHVRAWREDRADPRACYYFACTLLNRRGPLRALRFLRSVGELSEAPDEVRSDWYALLGRAYASFRDFDAAESWLERAERACPGKPWTCVEHAGLLAAEDRYEESLAVAERALERSPWYRPGVQAVADALQTLGRDREALALLTEAAERLENAPIVAQLSALQSELGLAEEAWRCLDRFAELAPLLETEGQKWLAARRSDLAYERGDVARAIELARESESPFHLRVADRLARPDPHARRVRLPVGFVRQHHQTCAPSTLAAICAYWGRSVDHLEVAGEICYDGTPDHREREWVERNGWAAREFAVTREAARALIDRGVPFTLTTISTAGGHLQAVIGYDDRRGTLLIRDPGQPFEGEADSEGLLGELAAWGPRGMALVPSDRAELLEGLELPDAALYDRYHRVGRALWNHRRADAAAELSLMEAEAPGHRLTLGALRLLANYDTDHRAYLRAVEGLLGLYPGEPLLELSRLACLRDLSRREERLGTLRGLAGRADADPAFGKMLARELSGDARQAGPARHAILRVLRARPVDPEALAIRANLLWSDRRRDEAMELYRFALCLEDKDEGLARSYFLAARHLGRTDEALGLLGQRFTRFGQSSGQPARTLFNALSLCERMVEAFAVLDEAMGRRPLDGELTIFAAEQHASHGNFALADELLTRAEGRVPRTAWLRARAFLESCRGESLAALGLWRELLALEPLAVDAHRASARLLAATEGHGAALAHLDAACREFPHHLALGQLRVEWVREEGPAALEVAVRRHLEDHPTDAWAHRELALALAGQGRADDALAAVEEAGQLEPGTTEFHGVLGQVLARAGRREEMAAAYREAIRISVDNDFAVSRLIEACGSQAERREALAFVWDELIRQVISGDGLIAYQVHARDTLEPEELLQSLRDALAARPDLWHAWAAVTRQLLEMERTDEALALVGRATERFPLLPRLWVDKALVCRRRADAEGEIEALREALRISPGWSMAARQLSFVLERLGRLEEAREVLEAASGQDPLDAENHAWLADALWNLGRRPEALDRMAHALRLDCHIEWAWTNLQQWAAQLERPNDPAELARELTARRPADAQGWILLARYLTGPEDLAERLDALDRAAALEPLGTDAPDQKAYLLAEAGRFDEAAAACRPPAWGEHPPHVLRGRAAWVLARQGDVDGAIAAMRAIVADEPSYYWGWSRLALWYRDQDRARERLEAVEQLVRLAPRHADALAERGEAHTALGNRAAARSDYEAALRIEPGHVHARLALFDLLLEGGAPDDAAEALRPLTEGARGPYVLAREVQLAARRRNLREAREALALLCATPADEDGTWPFTAADQAMASAGWGNAAARVYRKALDRGGAHPRAAALWIERTHDWLDLRRDRLLARLLEQGAVGRAAMEAYLNVLVRRVQLPMLRRCLRRHKRALRADVRLWGHAGYALTALRAFPQSVRWLADWQTREGVASWMLANLVISLRSVGRDDEAAAVSRRATELPVDSSTAQHVLWLALDDALRGDVPGARERLDRLGPYEHDPANVVLRCLVLATLHARGVGAEESPPSLRESRRAISALGLLRPVSAADRTAILRAYRRVLAVVAREHGGWRAAAWRRWRSLVPTFGSAPG